MDHGVTSRRRPRPAAAVLAAVVVVTIPSACTWTENDTRSATAGLPDIEQVLASERWVLADTSGGFPVGGPAAPTLVFGDGAVHGVACDRYEGTFEVDDHTVDIRDVTSVDRACSDVEQGGDDAYLAALRGTHEVDVTDRDRLVLTRDGFRLEFAADPNPPVPGG
jgi:heat shock protein HslJ